MRAHGISTTEELIMLDPGTVLRGPDWHSEVYMKVGDVEFMGIGSDEPWLASNLEPRGPFIILWPTRKENI